MRTTRQKTGDLAEIEITKLIRCPNCENELECLPPNNPLFDVQCTKCVFRAQVKSGKDPKKNMISGAGWDIMEKIIKSGFMVPPLIVNYKWVSKRKSYQRIVFYPFIFPKKNLKQYKLSPSHRQANYRMFNYVKLKDLPYRVLLPLHELKKNNLKD